MKWKYKLSSRGRNAVYVRAFAILTIFGMKRDGNFDRSYRRRDLMAREHNNTELTKHDVHHVRFRRTSPRALFGIVFKHCIVSASRDMARLHFPDESM